MPGRCVQAAPTAPASSNSRTSATAFGSAASRSRADAGDDHGCEQELAVDAQVPDVRPGRRRSRPAGDEQQRRHADDRVLPAGRAQQTAVDDVAVEGHRVPPEGSENDRAGDEREQRSGPTERMTASATATRVRGARRCAGAVASGARTVSAITRPSRRPSARRRAARAPGPLSTIPASRPRESTAIRSQRSTSSSRSVEITIEATPRPACSRMRSRTACVVRTSRPYVGLLKTTTFGLERELAGEHDLLDVPARERAATRVSVLGVRTSKSLDECRRDARRSPLAGSSRDARTAPGRCA